MLDRALLAHDEVSTIQTRVEDSILEKLIRTLLLELLYKIVNPNMFGFFITSIKGYGFLKYLNVFEPLLHNSKLLFME